MSGNRTRRGRGGRNASKPTTRASQSQQSPINENSFSFIQPAECCLCKSTFTEIEDKLLCCEFCDDGWKCLECAGLSVEMYDALQKSDDIVWICPDCKKFKSICEAQIEKHLAPLASKIINEVNESLTPRIESLENKTKTLETEMSNKVDVGPFTVLDTKVIDLEAKNDKAFHDISGLNKRIEEIVNEPNEIESRKLNLVLSGMPETDDFPDQQLVEQTLNLIGINEKPAFIRRLGQVTQNRRRPRPIKVIMPSQESKDMVLKCSPKLRDIDNTGLPFDANRIFIGNDLTKLQREREFTKRQERRRRKENRNPTTARAPTDME